MDYFRNSMGPVEECLCDSGINKRNVHVVAFIARFHTNSRRAEDDPRTLHGVDGLVFAAYRNCIADELGKQDYVTGEM